MYCRVFLICLAALSLVRADEEVLGIYVYHRPGARPPKSGPDSDTLTPEGAQQMQDSGSRLRKRYIEGDGHDSIAGISGTVNPKQVLVSLSPTLQKLHSASAFLGGLFPPADGKDGKGEWQMDENTGSTLLRTGNVTFRNLPIRVPDVIPLNNSEGGLQNIPGPLECPKAIESAERYFKSAGFQRAAKEYQSFFNGLDLTLNDTVAAENDGRHEVWGLT